MKQRTHFIEKIDQAFEVHPVVAILGPSQCGKMTLARMYKEHVSQSESFTYFDLEDPRHLARLESPILALEELDLFLPLNGKKLGFEIKYTDSPKVTRSMTLALELLKLDQLTVIVPGTENYPLTPKIRVQGLEHYLRLSS